MFLGMAMAMAMALFVVGWPQTASKAVLRQMSGRKGQCWTDGQNSNLTDMSSQVERTLTNPVVMQLLLDSRWIRNPDFKEQQARTDGAGNNPGRQVSLTNCILSPRCNSAPCCCALPCHPILPALFLFFHQSISTPHVSRPWTPGRQPSAWPHSINAPRADGRGCASTGTRTLNIDFHVSCSQGAGRSPQYQSNSNLTRRLSSGPQAFLGDITTSSHRTPSRPTTFFDLLSPSAFRICAAYPRQRCRPPYIAL